MSFDYLSDIFGKFRKRKTRFSDVESWAIRLIKAFVAGEIQDREFANEFSEIGNEFNRLTEVNGEITFDEDTPLWLNMFLGNHFIGWYRYQQLKWYFEEHPEELTGAYRARYARIQSMGYDERFQETCKNVLEEVREI